MKPNNGHKRSAAWLGYIPLSKDTPIPQNVEEIKLHHAEHGPINLTVEKPFRVWVSPIETTPDGNNKQASLAAYQKLLTEAIGTVKHAKGQYVMYVKYETNGPEIWLGGLIYKISR